MKFKRVLLSLTILILFNACDLNEGPTLFYRHIVTLETNLDSLHYNKTYLNSTTVYPYTIINLYEPIDLNIYITFYPVLDTGQIHFNMYRGEGDGDISSTSFIDSLTIYTPIDTTMVIFRSGGGIDSIMINPEI